jgi:hypothetical protein
MSTTMIIDVILTVANLLCVFLVLYLLIGACLTGSAKPWMLWLLAMTALNTVGAWVPTGVLYLVIRGAWLVCMIIYVCSLPWQALWLQWRHRNDEHR